MQDLRMKENITSKDVRFHHRICDAQKHLVQGTGHKCHKFVQELRKIVRIVVGGHEGLTDVKEKRILSILKTCG